VRAEVDLINENLPSGMRLIVAYDTSTFIDRAISSVFSTIGEAIILVVLVIFFFLRSLRATIIPIVTIPVSLIGAFALMYAFGFTVNTLTLLAMVLAIGWWWTMPSSCWRTSSGTWKKACPGCRRRSRARGKSPSP
jgi:multidrug efflux pump